MIAHKSLCCAKRREVLRREFRRPETQRLRQALEILTIPYSHARRAEDCLSAGESSRLYENQQRLMLVYLGGL